MNNSKRKIFKTQLIEANNRSRMYAQRLWVLPFAYIGVIFITLNATTNGQTNLILLCMITLSIMGLIVFCIMIGIVIAIGDAVRVIEKMEKKLKLKCTVKRHRCMIDVPTFSLAIVGITFCIISAIQA